MRAVRAEYKALVLTLAGALLAGCGAHPGATLTPKVGLGTANGSSLPTSTDASQTHLTSAVAKAPSNGWVERNGRVLRTEDDGGRWVDVSPSIAPGAGIIGITFLSQDESWVVGAPALTSYVSGQTVDTPLIVLHTTDGGRHWSSQGSAPVGRGPAIASAHLSFINGRTGWLSLGYAHGTGVTGGGALYRTDDSGATWTLAQSGPDDPVAQVAFVTETVGWGLTNSPEPHLFRTQDGGKTWSKVALPMAANAFSITEDLPVLFGPGEGVVAALVRTQTIKAGATPVASPRIFTGVQLFQTTDGGNSWLPRNPLQDARFDAGSSIADIPHAIISPTHWLIGADQVIFETADAGQTWDTYRPSVPVAVGMQMNFASDSLGWLAFARQSCSTALGRDADGKPIGIGCTVKSRILKTTDGGRTWNDDTPSGEGP